MKRYLGIVLIVLLALFLGGCGESHRTKDYVTGWDVQYYAEDTFISYEHPGETIDITNRNFVYYERTYAIISFTLAAKAATYSSCCLQVYSENLGSIEIEEANTASIRKESDSYDLSYTPTPKTKVYYACLAFSFLASDITWEASLTLGDSVYTLDSYNVYNITLTSRSIMFSYDEITDSYILTQVLDKSLTSLNLSDRINGRIVSGIASKAFENCSSLKTIILPDTITSIGSGAFTNCSSLEYCNLPSTLTTLNDQVFYGCSALTSVTLPDTMTSIGNLAFYSCYNLTSITLPKSLNSLGLGAFVACGLESIVIPENVTEIKNYTFSGCNSLKSITLLGKITEFYNQAFIDCSSLTTINFSGTLSEWKSITLDTDWNRNTGNYSVYCSDGTLPKSNN